MAKFQNFVQENQMDSLLFWRSSRICCQDFQDFQELNYGFQDLSRLINLNQKCQENQDIIQEFKKQSRSNPNFQESN